MGIWGTQSFYKMATVVLTTAPSALSTLRADKGWKLAYKPMKVGIPPPFAVTFMILFISAIIEPFAKWKHYVKGVRP